MTIGIGRRRIRRVIRSAALTLAAAALTAPHVGAHAEAKPTTGAPTSQARSPEKPVVFGDWTLRCGTAPSGERACEVGASVSRAGQSGPIAQLAFGRPVVAKADAKTDAKTAKEGKEQPADARPATMRLVVLVPVNVTIAPGVELLVDPAQPPLKLPLKTCIQAACFAEIELGPDEMQQFHDRKAPGRLTFTDPGGNGVAVDLSFKGLDQALDALAKR